MSQNQSDMVGVQVRVHEGGCHCGAVRIAARVDLARAARCNCSVCTKIAGTTSIVKPEDFRLLAGQADLSLYAWGGRTGQRYFCKHCGVHVFLRGNLPQLGGAYVSVALNCLDDVDPAALSVVHFDGRHNNWMAGPRPTPWPIAEEIAEETAAKTMRQKAKKPVILAS